MSQYTAAIQIRPDMPSILGAFSAVTRGLMMVELLTARQQAAQIQVDRAQLQLINSTIRLGDAHLRLGDIEYKYNRTQNEIAGLTQKRAGLQKELTAALESGTGTSFQYQQASLILSATNRDLARDQEKSREEAIRLQIAQDQLTISTNNVNIQEKILQENQQRLSVYNTVLELSYLSFASSLGGVIFKLYQTVVAIRAAQAAQVELNATMGAGAAGGAGAIGGAAALAVLAGAAGYMGVGAGTPWEPILAGLSPAYLIGDLLRMATAGGGGGGGTARMEGPRRGQYGGLITSPTTMLLGEAGPEMVTPLGAGGGANVNVFMSGGIIGINSNELAEQIAIIVNRYMDTYIRGNG